MDPVTAASAAGGPGACVASDHSSLWAPPTAVYGNSLWLAEDASEDTAPSPLRMPLKTMQSGPSLATGSVVDEGLSSLSSKRPSPLTAAADLAHLIAPSRSTCLATEPSSSWLVSTKQSAYAGKDAGQASVSSSPRIAAVHCGSSTALDAAEGFNDLGLGSLLSRRWWMAADSGLPAEPLPADAAAEVAAAKADDALQPAPPALASQLDIGFEVEAALWRTRPGSSSSSSSSSSPGAASSACRASPAHLIAPAPPAFPDYPSPVAAPGKACQASGSTSSSGSKRRHQSSEQPSEHKVLPELYPGLAPLGREGLAIKPLLSICQQQQQQSATDHGMQKQQQTQEQAAKHTALQLEQLGAVQVGRDAARYATSPADVLDCAGTDAWQPGLAGSSAATSHLKTWLVDSSHIELSFGQPAARCSTCAAAASTSESPVSVHGDCSSTAARRGAAAGPGVPLLALHVSPRRLAVADPAEQQLPEHTVGDSAAGLYGQILQSLLRLDLSKPRRAVRASLRSQESAAPARLLLQRLALGCFAGQAGNSRTGEQERVHLLCLSRLPYSPDNPLHFHLFCCVCRGFMGGEPESVPAVGGQPPWEVLGFSAANPAGDLGDTGLLCLLLLLLLLDRAPDLAARLLASSGGAAAQLGPQQQKQSPGFCLAEVAVEVTGWVQRALAGGSLAKDGSFHRAEAFWLAGVDAFLTCWEEALAAANAPQGRPGLQQDRARLLLAVLHRAERQEGGMEE